MMQTMVRTTLTLDPDVEALVRKSMRERGLSFKEAVNSALRQALTTAEHVTISFATFDLGEASTDLTHARRVAAELDDDEIARDLDVGR